MISESDVLIMIIRGKRGGGGGHRLRLDLGYEVGAQ